MQVCSKCGQSCPDHAVFCSNCGNQLTGTASKSQNDYNNGYNSGNTGYNNGFNNGNAGYNGGYNNGNAGYNNGYSNGNAGYSNGYSNAGYNNGYNNGFNNGNAGYNNSYSNVPGYYHGGVNPAVLQTALHKLNVSATIWLIIGIYQIVVGIPLACVGYGLLTLGLGIWNLVQVNTMKKNITFFQQNPHELVPYYEGESTKIIIFLFLNLFLGAFFGVIASIYELTTKNYILNHRHELG